MALSPRLLLAAAKLRELASDGVVEASSADLARTLGASTRTLRTVLGELAEAKALSFSSGRGPGALVRVDFDPEKRKERRKEKRKEAEEAEGKAEEAETGRGRGGVTQTPAAAKETAAAAGKQAPREKRKEAEGEAEGEAEAARVVVHRVEVVHRLDAESLALLRALGGRVSPREAEPQAAQAPTPAASPPPAAPAIVDEPKPSPQQVKEALVYRVEKQRRAGFKKGEEAFVAHLVRSYRKNPREVFETLDEKREQGEVRTARAEAAAVEAREPVRPPPVVVAGRDCAHLDELRKHVDAERSKKAAQKILESSAARRGVAT